MHTFLSDFNFLSVFASPLQSLCLLVLLGADCGQSVVLAPQAGGRGLWGLVAGMHPSPVPKKGLGFRVWGLGFRV